jgi:hypothetical protein
MRAVLLSAIFGLAAVASTATPPPAFDIIVTTADGNVYVAGSGGDCAAAWDRAAIPADWREIICIGRNGR